jgi:hypothetical protein
MPKVFVSYIQCGCVYDIFVHIFTKYMWIRKKLINQSQVRPLILFSNVWCRNTFGIPGLNIVTCDGHTPK